MVVSCWDWRDLRRWRPLRDFAIDVGQRPPLTLERDPRDFLDRELGAHAIGLRERHWIDDADAAAHHDHLGSMGRGSAGAGRHPDHLIDTGGARRRGQVLTVS